MGFGRYRIDRYLTEGGMGAIYVGRRVGAGGFEREVVLKQLLPEFVDRPEFRDLFFREAKISAGLDHVNIVRTFDLVRAEDALFIVMEYVVGTDLRTLTWKAKAQRKAVSVAAVLHIGMEVLAGLAYAHARCAPGGSKLGIVHRDISPSNILCSGQGDVKVSDFGIAKASPFASVFYRVRGKVGYMSPEQARTQPLDGRSDLYSLAVCLFETLTGRRLFVGDLNTPPDEIYAQPLPSLRALRPDAPAALDAVMAKALAHSPQQRFASAEAFSQALRDVARDHHLLYSASELSAELAQMLGPDPSRWSQDDGAALAVGETQKLAVARNQLQQAHGGPLPAGDAGNSEITEPLDELTQEPVYAPLPGPGAGRPAVPSPLPKAQAAAEVGHIPQADLEVMPLSGPGRSNGSAVPPPRVLNERKNTAPLAQFEMEADPRRRRSTSGLGFWLVILFAAAAATTYLVRGAGLLDSIEWISTQPKAEPSAEHPPPKSEEASP